MSDPTITLVVAVSQNGVIGRDGGLPWRLSSDLKRFKADTMGRPIIMGRKTFQSIGRILPGRENIIISRDQTFAVDGATVCPDVQSALEVAVTKAAQMGADDIAIIGGGEIYRQTFDLADRLIVTWVLAEIDGDTRFPAIDRAHWSEVESDGLPAGEKDSHATRRVLYRRK
ncbi:MAG: dihydrofolate reductase [Rhizobiaceae bacterium]